MSNQLYRLNPLDSLDKPILRHMIREGVLVPVKPDYEAAAETFAAILIGVDSKKLSYATAIVDAALKGDSG